MIRVDEAWEKEMRDRLADKNERIQSLESENAALWAFVWAEDHFNDMAESGDWDGDDAAYHAMMAARESLRPYETVDVVNKPLPLL